MCFIIYLIPVKYLRSQLEMMKIMEAEEQQNIWYQMLTKKALACKTLEGQGLQHHQSPAAAEIPYQTRVPQPQLVMGMMFKKDRQEGAEDLKDQAVPLI